MTFVPFGIRILEPLQPSVLQQLAPIGHEEPQQDLAVNPGATTF